MDEFGFEVKRDADGYSVTLPHQCEKWGIAGDEYESVSYDDAVKTLERFIASAQAALVELREMAPAEVPYD